MSRQTPGHVGRQALRRQRGATLIEVLIAVLVLAIGLLGVAALQATALRANQSAFDRSQALIQNYAILDAMRANADVARSGAYNTNGWMCAVPTGTGRIGAERAAWIGALQANMGDSACGRIVCSADTCQAGVRWDDSRMSGGSATQELVVSTRL